MTTMSPGARTGGEPARHKRGSSAIDRSVDDAGRGEAVATQRARSEGPPFAEGRFGDEALASGASAVGARHVGFRPGLVDEDEPPRIDVA